MGVFALPPPQHACSKAGSLLFTAYTQCAPGIGEEIPVPDASAVAVIAAQSFHWMSSGATLREVNRILHPGGLLALLWNTRDVSKPWIR